MLSIHLIRTHTLHVPTPPPYNAGEGGARATRTTALLAVCRRLKFLLLRRRFPYRILICPGRKPVEWTSAPSGLGGMTLCF